MYREKERERERERDRDDSMQKRNVYLTSRHVGLNGHYEYPLQQREYSYDLCHISIKRENGVDLGYVGVEVAGSDGHRPVLPRVPLVLTVGHRHLQVPADLRVDTIGEPHRLAQVEAVALDHTDGLVAGVDADGETGAIVADAVGKERTVRGRSVQNNFKATHGGLAGGGEGDGLWVEEKGGGGVPCTRVMGGGGGIARRPRHRRRRMRRTNRDRRRRRRRRRRRNKR